MLRSLVRTKSHLRECLTQCRQCRILFLTHPRNRGRKDLRCPFGCRETHRKKSSTQRSVAYYATPMGKFKKKLQNDKRRKAAPKPQVQSAGPATHEISLNRAMVAYVRLVTSLIEGRPVGREEVREMLQRTLRQPRMVREKRIDYLVRRLREKPP